MDSNLADCFLCGASCDAKSTNQGLFISKKLNMPLIAVLTRVLRKFIEPESNEYFCSECIRKIKQYDNLVKLSSQIEHDLNKKFENKPVKSTNLLDDDYFVDQNEIRDFLTFKSNLDLNDNTQINENGVLDLTASASNFCSAPSPTPPPPPAPPEKLNETVDFVAVQNVNDVCGVPSKETIALLEELNHFDDVQGLEIIAVVDSLNDISDMQGVETISVEVEQLEQLEHNEDNEDEEFDESSEVDDDVVNDSDNGSSDDGKSYDAADENNVQSINNEQINIAKKRKTKTVQKVKRNDNNNTQSDSLSCNVCGRSYKSKGALGIHMVKHSDQNPHECEICKKVFTQRIGLLRHIAGIHTKEQQHQCHICGKRFIHSASYNMHKKIHLDERSKKCDICGSEFRSSSHMARHARSHTGERPFECEICGQKFSQRYNMRTHRNTHKTRKEKNDVKHFKCLACPESFVRRDKLNEHLMQVHEAAMIAD